MAGYQSNDGTSKANLRLVKLVQPEKARECVRKPPDDMPVGRYKVRCERAVKVMRYNSPTAEFRFIVIEGDYTGVLLPGWVSTNYGTYRLYCEVALGGELDYDPDEYEPPDPSIFVGKVFIVEAYYKSTTGRSWTQLDNTKNKGPWDSIRVVKITSLVKS